MGAKSNNWVWVRSHRVGIALAVYAGAGWVAVRILAAVREYAGLPENLDSGFVAVFVAGFIAMVTLLKTHVAGGGPPVLHALRVVSVVLMFAASGLLVAHWVHPGSGITNTPSAVVSGPDHTVESVGIVDDVGCEDKTIDTNQ